MGKCDLSSVLISKCFLAGFLIFFRIGNWHGSPIPLALMVLHDGRQGTILVCMGGTYKAVLRHLPEESGKRKVLISLTAASRALKPSIFFAPCSSSSASAVTRAVTSKMLLPLSCKRLHTLQTHILGSIVVFMYGKPLGMQTACVWKGKGLDSLILI